MLVAETLNSPDPRLKLACWQTSQPFVWNMENLCRSLTWIEVRCWPDRASTAFDSRRRAIDGPEADVW